MALNLGQATQIMYGTKIFTVQHCELCKAKNQSMVLIGDNNEKDK